MCGKIAAVCAGLGQGMGLRAPLYVRRCLGRRRCAIPCALVVLIVYGIYSKNVPVPEELVSEVDSDLHKGAASLQAFGNIVGAGGFEPGDPGLPHSPTGDARAKAMLDMQATERVINHLEAAPSSHAQAARPTDVPLASTSPPALPPPPPPPPPRTTAIDPLTVELMSSMDEPAKRAYAASFNIKQEVLNRDLLPTPLGSAPVIVVMVHNRPLYFARVLRSLQQVRGIEKALLVVSLDYLSPEMDALVRGIKFCAVIQIFCPASAQLYSAEFPGTDPRDCAGGWDSLPRDKAKASGCINWATPDKYGHYREAKVRAYQSLPVVCVS